MSTRHFLTAVFFLLTLALPALVAVAQTKTRSHPEPAPRKLLYLRAEFADKPIGGGPNGSDISDEEWLKRLEKLNAFAEEYWVFNSYGAIASFEATYSEVFQLPEALTEDSPYRKGADVQKIRVDMLEAAKKAGFKPGDYDEVILSFPGVPGFPAGALGGGGFVWMPGHSPFDGGFVHEYGHAIGVGHASSLEGEGKTIYPGEHREGRDGLFMMGSEGGAPPIRGRPTRAPVNLPMRYKLGFVGDELIQPIVSPQRRPVRIYSFDRPSVDRDIKRKRHLAVVFQHDNREWWVSYAPSLSLRWAKESAILGVRSSVWLDGVMVHELSGSITRLLDFTPGSQGEGNEADYVDTRDGALRVGQSFTFPDGGPTLTIVKTGRDRRDKTPWIEIRLTAKKRR